MAKNKKVSISVRTYSSSSIENMRLRIDYYQGESRRSGLMSFKRMIGIIKNLPTSNKPF